MFDYYDLGFASVYVKNQKKSFFINDKRKRGGLMNNRAKDVSNAVLLMEKYLNENVQERKLWKKSFVKDQIKKRKEGGTFDLSDHVRAMVYSMLSAEKEWYLVQPHIDNGDIDNIFKEFCVDELLQCEAGKLTEQIREKQCASRLTSRQMEALSVNINKLIEIEKQCGSVDTFYQCLCDKDNTYKMLICTLSSIGSPYKLQQMGEALVTEYLKNVGYDICKPDRHICRVLGCNVLGCSDKEEVPVYEAIDIMSFIANELNKPIAEVDYILWSYCAKGYGQVCTKSGTNCDRCVIKNFCCKQGGK